MDNIDYDVIVVGAGHAGCEAAIASARMGCSTLCLTLNLDNIALMPCNPSIGGPAKGHLVKEIDALGGQIAINTDKTLLQIRMLNGRKGPAVRALRAQVDKVSYHLNMKRTMETEPNLFIKQMLVEGLLVENGIVKGVRCRGDITIRAKSVVLTTGTFLKSTIHIGKVNYSGGPHSQLPSINLSNELKELGINLIRFKTGTPARVNSRTIDFSKMIEQPGDSLPSGFSFQNIAMPEHQLSCWLTYTNSTTHEIIHNNLHVAPMYSGAITGIGPRYCPSIESKVVTFPEKEMHQVFLEPEGLHSCEYYLGGLSTSLPEDIQSQFLRTIPGLEKVHILRYGYAIEYDVVVPSQLTRWLEFKEIKGLFSAGQINGTSGYEEAAAQGLIAGINASLRVKEKEPVILERDEAYIGVLIDDLVTKGIEEPYRMLTTRAEYRLLLRQDNADRRLTEKAWNWGVVTENRMEALRKKERLIEDEYTRVKTTSIPDPDSEDGHKVRLSELIKRPEHSYKDLKQLDTSRPDIDDEILEQVEIGLKYEGYINLQIKQVERMKKHENKKIIDIDFTKVPGLASEAREKLIKIMPDTIGQASRIPGVNPADVTSLLVYLAARIKKERGN